jgi:thiamine transport system ATP-binding protein
MADRVVDEPGRIEQSARRRRIYTVPRTRFVAQFVGMNNLIDATVQGRTGAPFWPKAAAGG